MATRIAVDGPGGLVVAGDYLRRDSSHIPHPGSTTISDFTSSSVQPMHDRRDVHTVQATTTSYMCYMCETRMFQHGERNNHTCTFKFTCA